ncbi:hypothetical protein [Kosakonia sp. 1610]|uniref:hypothetical protein n=1 Tax=Kosakonia sp. 1610 TaxID=3156426 RepID=UPI003D2199C1
MMEERESMTRELGALAHRVAHIEAVTRCYTMLKQELMDAGIAGAPLDEAMKAIREIIREEDTAARHRYSDLMFDLTR